MGGSNSQVAVPSRLSTRSERARHHGKRGTVTKVYFAVLADGGRRPSTIGRALAAISVAHVRAGFPSPRVALLAARPPHVMARHTEK